MTFVWTTVTRKRIAQQECLRLNSLTWSVHTHTQCVCTRSWKHKNYIHALVRVVIAAVVLYHEAWFVQSMCVYPWSATLATMASEQGEHETMTNSLSARLQ